MQAERAYYSPSRGFLFDTASDSEGMPLSAMTVLPNGQYAISGGGVGDNIPLVDPAGVPWMSVSGQVLHSGHDPAYVLSGYDVGYQLSGNPWGTVW